MRRGSSKILGALLAAAVLALTATPIESAHGAAPSAKALKGVPKPIKALKKQIAALTKRIAALEAKGADGGGGPTGPAGGDLSGSYPNPELRAGSVFSAEIADGAIGAADIGPNAILGPQIVDRAISGVDIALETITGAEVLNAGLTGGDIANNSISKLDLSNASVGGSQLFGTTVATERLTLLSGQTGEIFAPCPPGARLLSGGAEWEVIQGSLFTTGSAPTANNAWKVTGANNSNATRTLLAKALCLSE